ncbi:hypothetical protein [Chelativorans sp. J32]|uniref:hypothetical protein n=1 Tax=Chelativorans sp. J32 TaxID=935840 RepID=UPI0004BBD195|nr:hypothetical protein [Chelativorans sp. J32]
MLRADIHRPVLLGSAERALFLAAALAFVLPPLSQPPLAQGLQSQESIDAIVGSDVKTEETTKNAQVERILAAIEMTQDSAERVRKAFTVNALEIVFLPDLGKGSGAIEKAIEEHEEDIEALRDSIEGSAMFYHAIDSREILLQDVVAVEFSSDDSATIFVTGDER